MGKVSIHFAGDFKQAIYDKQNKLNSRKMMKLIQKELEYKCHKQLNKRAKSKLRLLYGDIPTVKPHTVIRYINCQSNY